MTKVAAGQAVFHPQFGTGHVEFNKGTTAIIRFKHGLEECALDSLQAKSGVLEDVESGRLSQPIKAICRVMAEAIISVNDNWGVFSKSRIALLPHQLWVCHRVLRKWPAQILVADDVGLGKTIEAGLILWPLLAKNQVKRLLVICPASLVEQWQYRLRDMFDIRLARYLTEADTPRADFWNTQNQVVASMQTLRDDRRDRHQRIFEAEPWDLLIVDEAHHLNSDEERGATLAYKLVEGLVKENLTRSRIFFTGTPHRGKDYGFFSLLRLLRPEQFSPNRPLEEQLPHIRDVIIRNNKQNVTDMQGNKIFRPVNVTSETYSYTEEEAAFYDLLTEFIATGKAYASKLSSTDQRAVMLVLISMQKLASSSIAAIRKALSGRLLRLSQAGQALQAARERQALIRRILDTADETNVSSLTDELQRQEEIIAEISFSLPLMEDEIPQLKILVDRAETVTRETKIEKIIEVLDTRFAGRAVLFFTEYKATQALLMSALMQKFGDDCVSFINGDNRIDGVIGSDGVPRSISIPRTDAADLFNYGIVRFLVSTEAAGEGIDLQESCYSLIHVDLPWNPMRLHQRVGRLNRYGQKMPVEVINLRNPATVESRIWGKLNEKIESIMRALGGAMDEPEDLLQLVLGMTSPTLFTELFVNAAEVSDSRLDNWFNSKTKTFGGKDAIDTVKALVGNCSRFDYQNLESIPKNDLEDLQLFFEAMLSINKRRVIRENAGIAFKTPEEWLKNVGIRRRYEGLLFERNVKGKEAALRVVGVGHKVFDQAITQAANFHACFAAVSDLSEAVSVFEVYDRITSQEGNIKQIIVGVASGKKELLHDWQLIDLFNDILKKRKITTIDNIDYSKGNLIDFTEEAESLVKAKMYELNTPFNAPETKLLSLFIPTAP
ncbi:helicase, Snf2 family [Desulfosarcina variabilis str. Montpellier]|uniref:DEAD/DEAH box helicase n=1 Tax=Desulfosarcina variabilis TaxID=2300 RepID=UPI003AFB327C